MSSGAWQSPGVGVRCRDWREAPPFPHIPPLPGDPLRSCWGSPACWGGGAGGGLSGAGLESGVAICICLTPSLGPCRGIVTGIYTTSSPEACQYSALDCRASVIVVDTQKQLEKILKV